VTVALRRRAPPTGATPRRGWRLGSLRCPPHCSNELFPARIPPSEGTLVEIVDDVFLPLVRPR